MLCYLEPVEIIKRSSWSNVFWGARRSLIIIVIIVFGTIYFFSAAVIVITLAATGFSV